MTNPSHQQQNKSVEPVSGADGDADNPDHNSRNMAALFGQSLLTKLLMIVFRLARNAILARVLGPADRGLFSLITSLPELIMTAGNAGLSNAAPYYAGKKNQPLKSVLGNTNVLILALSLILMIASTYLIQQDWLVKEHAGTLSQFLLFISLAIPLMLLKVVNQNILNVLHKVLQVNTLNLCESLLPLLLFLALWGLAGMDALIAAVWAWIVSLGTIALLSLLNLKQGFPLKLDQSIQRDLLSYGTRGHFDTLFQKLLLRIDFIFVSSFLGTEALGYYAMATAAAELLLVLPNALTIPLFSFLMRRSSVDKNAVTPIVLRVLTFVMIVFAVFFALTGKLLIAILFGNAYLPAYEPLLLLLPGVVFLSYCSLIRLDLLGSNMPGTVSIISGTAVAVNLLLNVALINSMGINGVAIASTLSYGIAALGLYRVHSKHTGLSAKETLLIRRNDFQLMLRLVKR